MTYGKHLGSVEAEPPLESERIVIRSEGQPRHGWDEAFAAMAEQGDDALLDPETGDSAWDAEEWEWQ